MLTKEQEIDAAWTWYEEISQAFPGELHRRNLAVAQGWLCHYCDREMTEYDGTTHIGTDVTLDHKHPVSKGGTNELNNLVAACARCNNEKADIEYDAYLRWIGK